MEITTLTTKINKLKLKISNGEDEILDIDEQIKLLKLKRKEKLQKVETMIEKVNDYIEQRKELKKQSNVEPVNITSIPSDIMHNYIAKYLLDGKRPFISNITHTKIYRTLEKKQDPYLNNLLFGKPRLPFIFKEDFNTFTEHNLKENKYFIQYIKKLYELNFDVEVSIQNVNVKYYHKQDKNNKLKWKIEITDNEFNDVIASISDFKISLVYEKHYWFTSDSEILREQCMIRDTKIISIISKLEDYIIKYKKRYTSFVEDFNTVQYDDSDLEDDGFLRYIL